MKPSLEPLHDSTIADLHRIREAIVESFHGDLDALTADAQLQQEASGRRIIRRGELRKRALKQTKDKPVDG